MALGGPAAVRLVTFIAALFGGACTHIPPGRSAIDEVTASGERRLDNDEITGVLATSPTPRFFWAFRGVVYEYELFDEQTFQRDLARVERLYHARGYFDARARAGRILQVGGATSGAGEAAVSKHVRVEILVDEGEATRNAETRIVGTEGLPASIVAAVKRASDASLPKGEPFDEARFEAIDATVRKALTDRGYAFATVTRDVYIDVGARRAETVVVVLPGELAKFSTVTITSAPAGPAGSKPEPFNPAPVRTAVDIAPGAPYSTARIAEATQALLDLGVFASVQVTPDLSHPETHAVPIEVRVELSKLRQVRLGFGVEFDEIKTELRGIIGWEHHNFLGGLRDLSVTFTPGVVFFPTRIDHIVPATQLLLEERLRVQFEQPGFLEPRTSAFVRPEFNIFPLLVQTDPPAGSPVVGFREFKGAIGLERKFWKRLYANLSYEAQVENPFSYVGPLEPGLRTLTLAYPELLLQWDLRDDPIHPHKGLFLANDLQVAGGIFGGNARDVRVQPEVRSYLPVARGVTFATRASVGLLFASNYGNVVQNELAQPVTAANLEDRVRDIETVFFRGFFSGGPTSNRGFPIRGIAPHGVVPFVIPSAAAQQVATSCTPTQANNYSPDPSVCSISIGGFSLWELSNELRFVIKGPASGTLFCDMGDVSPHPYNLRFDHLHLSCGVGARYDTPVGPIRFDVGYRIQPLQVVGYKSGSAAYAADPTEGLQPTIFGLPIAFAVGIGEAY